MNAPRPFAWDPEVESPASIAIIGAGPVGIEAALYARFLGYDVELLDAGRPARRATAWHHRSMGLPTARLTTPLGLAALSAQDPEYKAPSADRIWTGAEYAHEYLIPLAKTDLVEDSVRINSPVVDVARWRHTADETDDLQARANDEFRLVIDSRDRGMITSRADIVIDARGWQAGQRGLGPGGGMAIGEGLLRAQCQAWWPGDAKFSALAWDRKRTALYGPRSLIEPRLDELNGWLSTAPDAQLLWLEAPEAGPSGLDAVSPALPTERPELPERFQRLAVRGIERMERTEGGPWRLQLAQADDSLLPLEVDQLAVRTAPAPTPCLGPTLLHAGDFLEPSASMTEAEESPGWEGWRVATAEPHYYRLGSRTSAGAGSLREAHFQIRHLFALLGGRRDLDLYDIMERSKG